MSISTKKNISLRRTLSSTNVTKSPKGKKKKKSKKKKKKHIQSVEQSYMDIQQILSSREGSQERYAANQTSRTMQESQS